MFLLLKMSTNAQTKQNLMNAIVIRLVSTQLGRISAHVYLVSLAMEVYAGILMSV